MKRYATKILKRTLWLLLFLFIVANVVAAMHAYKFTHFSTGGERPKSFNLTTAEKLRLLFTGVDNPRPANVYKPLHQYTTVNIQSNVNLECWYMPAVKSPKGTVLLFHGYTSCKALLLDRAQVYIQGGYNCLLVDFMGSGGSGGNSTTVGFKEAQEVADCYRYIQQKGEKNIFLYGSSMGAVAIMKAINDGQVSPAGVIIDCPFATMKETVGIRFTTLGVPQFPMANLLMFWGGLENGFNASAHNPVDYAKNVHCPTLLQYGGKDERVGRNEIDRIYKNLAGHKQLAVYTKAGHDNFLLNYRKEWSKATVSFLDKNRAK